MLNEMDLTIWDFETSGLDPLKEQVIEMAALKIHKGIITGSFNCFVKHDKQLSQKITELTGIVDDDLKDGFDEDIAFKMLKQFMGNNIIGAHNATFDLAFLHHSRMRLFNQSFSNSFIDTLTIARDRVPFPHKLTDLTTRHNIEMDTAHRALADVYGCYKLLQHYDKEESVEPWINRLGYVKKWGPATWYPEHAKPFEQGYKN
ncbi:3'-5' exonuclease [Paenibacillus psychroresistens]|uniref:3'-5' exonuclease n=1 Tax=Paenibacillus psychroresistens TaxID=1778678 RepID=A0A6B8RMU5_9BACL|nr:3'-5' exonuclease [Paenibacillus psychroresistens]QGQ97012.1 3'-5' exonuclease [Paenibacillus psychroresistens]